jgi:hypothetical protein
MEMTLTTLGLAGMTGARLGAAWAARSTPTESPSTGEEGDADTGMAPRPSSTSPSGTPAVAKRNAAPVEETDETPADRQARILAQYAGGKPGQRITPTTRLIDQAG